MRTLGIIGGMSWESTVTYYRLLNEGVRNIAGGLHSCPMVMHSVDFGPFAEKMEVNDWEGIAEGLEKAAKSVAGGGADALIIATNTMHKEADRVRSAVDIPLLHMADAIAMAAGKIGAKKLGLLGTAFTMEQDFLSRPLREKHGLEVIVPPAEERSFVHRTIFDELCCGKIVDRTKAEYIGIIEQLAAQGVDAVVLGCTEIGLLVGKDDVSVPLIDSVQAHVDLALDYVFGKID
ncbi:aspartate/glutamate racemase family protein [Maridesulfovibrio sp.]|uniref:aspartate/glutamate racemase family protein n=1 Tax=Maridesulfovibrio sp. TaxID=2795000 RepID=UPI002A18769E|nr:aspartate/glutamate racemase family protein [Maridesulfovibrio sp.]